MSSVPQQRRRLRTTEAATYLGIGKSTLEKLRLTGLGPIYVKAGPRVVVYDVADLDAWLSTRRRLSTSEAAHEAKSR